MEGSCRRSPGRGRPGLTLIELLVAIALLGVTGALLMPHLVGEKRPQIRVQTPAVGEYIGIGAHLSHQVTWDGFVRIDQPFFGAPAQAAGLEPGDVIVAVDGVNTQNEGPATVASRIRGGEVGSPVQMTLRRGDETVEATLTRQWINPPRSLLRWSDDARLWPQ